MEILEALGPDLHLVERFSLLDADTVLYEYACHEGNYGLTNILAGAQAEQRAAQSSSK